MKPYFYQSWRVCLGIRRNNELVIFLPLEVKKRNVEILRKQYGAILAWMEVRWEGKSSNTDALSATCAYLNLTKKDNNFVVKQLPTSSTPYFPFVLDDGRTEKFLMFFETPDLLRDAEEPVKLVIPSP